MFGPHMSPAQSICMDMLETQREIIYYINNHKNMKNDIHHILVNETTKKREEVIQIGTTLEIQKSNDNNHPTKS